MYDVIVNEFEFVGSEMRCAVIACRLGLGFGSGSIEVCGRC